VNNKLDGRITDVNFWKGELNREHREIVEEIKMLQQFIGRLERALAATEQPLNVTRQNLDYRTRRVRIDLVFDNVEEILNKVLMILCVICIDKDAILYIFT
jgi:tektin-1